MVQSVVNRSGTRPELSVVSSVLPASLTPLAAPTQSVIPVPPTTSIFQVFAQVGQIQASLALLLAQAPTYSQFGASLRTLSQQVAAVQQQSTANANLINVVLLLIEAIIASMGTSANQNLILQGLEAIEAALAPTAPKSIGLDLTAIEILPQPRPARPGPL